MSDAVFVFIAGSALTGSFASMPVKSPSLIGLMSVNSKEYIFSLSPNVSVMTCFTSSTDCSLVSTVFRVPDVPRSTTSRFLSPSSVVRQCVADVVQPSSCHRGSSANVTEEPPVKSISSSRAAAEVDGDHADNDEDPRRAERDPANAQEIEIRLLKAAASS